MDKIALYFLSLALSLVLCAPTAHGNDHSNKRTGKLSVTITGVRNFNGTMAIALYDNKDQFLSDECLVSAKKEIGSGGEVIYVFDNLPYGEYAISVFHDENDNGVIDLNGIGIPKESFGFSNTKRVIFGPPSFNKAKFELNSDRQQVSIKLLNMFL